jgi:hypothetical protein
MQDTQSAFLALPCVSSHTWASCPASISHPLISTMVIFDGLGTPSACPPCAAWCLHEDSV